MPNRSGDVLDAGDLPVVQQRGHDPPDELDLRVLGGPPGPQEPLGRRDQLLDVRQRGHLASPSPLAAGPHSRSAGIVTSVIVLTGRAEEREERAGPELHAEHAPDAAVDVGEPLAAHPGDGQPIAVEHEVDARVRQQGDRRLATLRQRPRDQPVPFDQRGEIRRGREPLQPEVHVAHPEDAELAGGLLHGHSMRRRPEMRTGGARPLAPRFDA